MRDFVLVEDLMTNKVYQAQSKCFINLDVITNTMIPDYNQNFIDEYMLWYSENGGSSPETQRSARNSIRIFLEFYGGKELKVIEKADVTRYFIYLKTAKYHPRKKGSEPKQYSPQSLFQLKATLRGFLRWFSSEYGVPDLGAVKLKHVKQDRIKSDHITYDDCVKLIQVCHNQRDRAMIAFLLDSGVRRGELLKINYCDVKFENDGVIVHVPRGKTSPRRVYCVWCTQEMYHWHQQHPLKEPDSYFFCSNHPPYGKLSENGFWQQLHTIAERAGMPKIHAHLFRHSSATIYAAIEGMTDQKLKYRYGWTPSSKMADVYIKLSGKESDDDIRLAFDKPVVKKRVAGRTMVTCPRCRLDNYADDDICYNCQKALSEAAIAKERSLMEAKEAELVKRVESEVTKKLLDAFAVNEQKRKEYSKLENIIENMSGRPEDFPDVPDGVLQNIELTEQEIEDMPESNEDIVKRVIGKKD